MQFDLNRLSLEANYPVSTPRTGTTNRGVDTISKLPESQRYQRIGRIDREFKYRVERIIGLSKRFDFVFAHGSYRGGSRIPSFDREQVTISNSPSLQAEPVQSVAASSVEADAWDVLERLIGTIDGPSDWSSQHDHYLYGTPKR